MPPVPPRASKADLQTLVRLIKFNMALVLPVTRDPTATHELTVFTIPE